MDNGSPKYKKKIYEPLKCRVICYKLFLLSY